MSDKDILKNLIRSKLREEPHFVEVSEDYAKAHDLILKDECYQFAKELGVRFLIDPMSRSIVFVKLK